MSTPPVPPPPQHCPTPVELDDLELLSTGALAPLMAFNQAGSPITLTLPDDVAAAATLTGSVELVDPEGLPLARVAWPAGTVQPLTHAQYGPFRDLALPPASYRERYAGRTVVPVDDALSEDDLVALADQGPLTLLAFAGTGLAALSPVALVRATRVAAGLLPDAVVVTVPLASHGTAAIDHELGVRVAETFAGPDPVRALAGPVDDVEPAYPPAIAAVVDHDRPPLDRQGLVLFFTGLSGSGKSTLARALLDRLLEQGTRTVTSLDGDVVRRNLSAGLTFSKADRETNIRRIGWVAAEISRHGGVAVVSPIAPFDETRQQVRAMVEEAGGAFFLVHVATPLEECERRDRKGLYARARAGQIPEFTGISSPYEVPEDADVRVDTTGRTIDDALADVLRGLREAGYLDLAPVVEPVVEPVIEPVVEPVETPAADAPAGPLRVLFVCTANICRSPSLELLARRATRGDPDVVFTSAGTRSGGGYPIDEDMRATIGDGPDAEEFRSTRLTPEVLAGADLVLTAEAAHRTYILDDAPGLFRKVFTLGQFAEAVRRAPAGLSRADLLTRVGEQRGLADPALDVPDPYRQGPTAARACADRLQELLDVVLPALTSMEART